MNTTIKKLTVQLILIASAIALATASIIMKHNSQWVPVSIALISLLATAFWIRDKRRAEKTIQRTFKTVDEHVSNFLFNTGRKSSEDSLDLLATELMNATVFIKEIGEGKFTTDYEGMTDALKKLNKSNLSGELLNMKRKMFEVAEAEEQRSWVSTGIAHFSELARQQNKELSELLNQFVSDLARYINANQGGIYIVKKVEAKTILELKACYAYGRRKYIENSVESGEGLVGQAYLEGDVIYLTDVPANYISITSGLGQATPRCVILVPLKNHDVIEGIIEVASFNIWKKHEMDFLLSIGEILGSAISNIKTSEMTNNLLNESREQAEQLKAQEEELRQNLEEIHTTQEAIERKSKEALVQNAKLNAILDSAADTIITFNEHGTVESMNIAGMKLLGYDDNTLMGKHISLINDTFQCEPDFVSIIGKTYKIEAVKKNGAQLPVELTLTLSNVDGHKIYTCILRDITERIKSENEQLQYIEELRAQEEELKQNMEELQATQEEIHRQMLETRKVNQELDARVEALNTSTIMSESDLYGGILYVNDKFCEVSQYTREELLGKPHKIVRHDDMPKEVFKIMWETIKAGKVFRGIVKNKKKDGNHYWVDAVISPVLDENRKPIKYIGVRYVIDDNELGQRLFDKQMAALNRLNEILKMNELVEA